MKYFGDGPKQSSCISTGCVSSFSYWILPQNFKVYTENAICPVTVDVFALKKISKKLLI